MSLLTLCNMRAGVLWFLSCPVPHSRQISKKTNHTEISISYKADWPIRSGYLLALITYVTPLSLSTLAHGSVPFPAGQLTSFLSGHLGRTAEGASCFPEYSQSLFSISTSCLAFTPILPAWPISVLLKYD